MSSDHGIVTRRRFLTAAAASLPLVAAACSVPAQPSATAAAAPGAAAKQAPAQGGKGFVIGGLVKTLGEFWEDSHKAVDAVVKKWGGEVVWQAPTKEDVAKQREAFEGFIAQGVSGIVFGASDPGAFNDLVKKAQTSKIPCVTFEADAPPSGRVLYVGGEDYGYGYKAGEALAKKIGGKGKVAIQQGSATAANARGRADGMEAALKKGGCEVVTRDLDGEDAGVALTHAEQLIVTYPDLRGFCGVYADHIAVAATAVKAANKVGQIEITGNDPYGKAYDYIKDGTVFCAYHHNNYDMAVTAAIWVCNAVKFGLEHAYYVAGIDPDKPVADRKLFVRDILLTKENVDAYLSHFNDLKAGKWGIEYETWV